MSSNSQSKCDWNQMKCINLGFFRNFKRVKNVLLYWNSYQTNNLISKKSDLQNTNFNCKTMIQYLSSLLVLFITYTDRIIQCFNNLIQSYLKVCRLNLRTIHQFMQSQKKKRKKRIEIKEKRIKMALPAEPRIKTPYFAL